MPILSGGSLALVVPALVVIETQMESAMDSTGTRYLNLGKIEASKISEKIASYKPDILICAIETLARLEVQQALLSTKLVYIALDEAQVITATGFSLWSSKGTVNGSQT